MAGALIAVMRKHVLKDTGALIVSAVLDILLFAVVSPFSDSTPPETFTATLNMVYQGMYTLAYHAHVPTGEYLVRVLLATLRRFLFQ